jgi:hypothetical protein
MLGSGAGILGIAFLLARMLRESPRLLATAIAANLIALALMLAIVEAALHVLRSSNAYPPQIAGVPLRPTWLETVQNSRRVLDTPPRQKGRPYFVFDAELGWSAGSNRESDDGLYASSAEGVRSARPGVVYSDDKLARQVALVGDSNAFSLEVPFDDSWGRRLEIVLGRPNLVLNFGVDGYGIDQMFLRYQRDVRPWHPAVVIVAFIQHDLVRTMAVYPFLSFGWPGYLVKPRFDIEHGELRVINYPLPTPQQVLGGAKPGDLPNVGYDPGYASEDWASRFDRAPLTIRLITSIWPRWPSKAPLGNADTVALNQRLLGELMGSIERDGAKGVLVYLPKWNGDDSLARETLRGLNLRYLDLTTCLQRVPADLRRTPSGAHYTGLGNQAIAECTAPFAQ